MSESRNHVLPAFCIPGALLLCIPFIALIHETPWHNFHLAYGDGPAVAVSLGLSLVALAFIAALGTPLALWLARSRSVFCHAAEILVLLALLTPALAMGILLVAAYGPYGTFGALLERLGVTLTNNAGAFVMAQVYGGLAYYILFARAAFEAVPQDLEEAARVLGASEWQVFSLLTLPVVQKSLTIGLIGAAVRIVGEFGIVAVFAYFPQGIPVKLYVNLQNEGVDSVYSLVWLLLAVCLPLPLWLMRTPKRNSRSSTL